MYECDTQDGINKMRGWAKGVSELYSSKRMEGNGI